MADVQTDFTLAFVRHTINTNDEFYKAESDYSDEVSPMFSEIVQNGSLTLYNSKFRPEFEKKYGKILFTNIELMLKSFSPEIIPEMQEENSSQPNTTGLSLRLKLSLKAVHTLQRRPSRGADDESV